MALAFWLSGCGGGGVSDPESARCNHPTARFYAKQVEADHTSVLVQYTCVGARIAGTLYEPSSPGPHPALIWVHGSGEHTRLYFGDFVKTLVQAGIAVASFDKRGVGDSGGDCCLGDGHYNLLAADADGAVEALRNQSEIDPNKVGLFGASEAGWVVPLAVSRDPHVAFVALGSGPAVSLDEEGRWSKAAHEDEEHTPLPASEKQKLYADLKHGGGFDPLPYIRSMRIPGLWMFGGGDRSIPADRSAALIRGLHHENFTVVVFPNVGHGLFDTPPTTPRATPTLVRWVKQQVH
jgi:alpha-beta hydrolase superfamily lysophospholipase